MKRLSFIIGVVGLMLSIAAYSWWRQPEHTYWCEIQVYKVDGSYIDWGARTRQECEERKVMFEKQYDTMQHGIGPWDWALRINPRKEDRDAAY